MEYKEPTTQKGIGIVLGIPRIGIMFDCKSFYRVPAHTIVKSVQDIEKLPSYFFPGFARPCPKTPRHGFVESRKVKDKESLKKLIKQVIKEDPCGEIALGPCFDKITCSSIYTSSGLLSIGPDNDGATGGKDSFSIPVAPLKYDEEFLKEVKIDTKEAVYLESIFDKYTGCYITQVRGGPALSQSGDDYIPKTVKVASVVTPSQDLLAWEKEVKSFKSGTVVYGNGYTLASHAAVHCILHKIPFITSKKPSVGEVLHSTEINESSKLTREGFKRGVSYALKMTDRNELGAYFRYCLSILHNWAYLRKHPQADQMLGVGVTLFVKLCAALACGEYRHNNHYDMFVNHWREDVYSTVLSNGTKYLNKLPTICKNFCTGHWESGFGDLPWASCAWYSASIWDTIIKMYNGKCKSLSDKEIARLIDYINRTMNLVHNSNWWFDKISQKTAMDFAANYPGLCASIVADVFYRVNKGIKDLKKVKRRLPPLKKVKHPLTLNANGKLICAYIHPDDDAYNVKCPKCGYYDCWCKKKASPIKSTVKIWEEGNNEKHTKSFGITEKEFKAIKKYKLSNGRVYLKAVSKVGVILPTGRVIKCGVEL